MGLFMGSVSGVWSSTGAWRSLQVSKHWAFWVPVTCFFFPRSVPPVPRPSEEALQREGGAAR